MFVLRKTMEAAVESQRQIGAAAVHQLASRYGDALSRTSALQTEMSAWVMNKAENITPEQMAQMFYAQDDRWQAAFFNCMQAQVQAHHDALSPARPGSYNPSPGYPAGEGQWYHMAQHLTDEGFETVEAMYQHAKWKREPEDTAADVAA
jgi:hypothetical protein